MNIFDFFDDYHAEQAQLQAEQAARDRARQACLEARQQRDEARAQREAELVSTANERGKNWDAENVIPRICQAVVTKWGLPPSYEFRDFSQDVALRVWGNPWDEHRAGGRSYTSWVYLLAQSVWKNQVAKATRRRGLAPMTSYEERCEMGLM